MSDSLWPRGLYSPWNPLGQATGVGSLSLLQRIFLAQGLKPGLLHCRQILYQLSHKESPRILEWVAYPLSRDLPDPGIELGSPALQVDSLPTELSREAPTPIIRNYRLGFILFIYFFGGGSFTLKKWSQLDVKGIRTGWIHTLLYVKQITNKDLLYCTVCNDLYGKRILKSWFMCMYNWFIWLYTWN